MPVLTPETLAQLQLLSQSPGQGTGFRSLQPPSATPPGAGALQPRPAPAGRPAPTLGTGMNVLQGLSKGVNTAGMVGGAVNAFAGPQQPPPSPDVQGPPAPTSLISPQLMGSLQSLGGLLNIGMALQGQSGQSSASRALQGLGGATSLAGGALQAAPETAGALLPSTGMMSPGSLGTGLGAAGSLLGLGSGALALSEGNRDAVPGMFGNAVSLAAMLAGIPGGQAFALAIMLPQLSKLIKGPDKESAQSRWQGELRGSQERFIPAMYGAQSLEDVANVHGGITGTRIAPESFRSPDLYPGLLSGSTFDQNQGGSLGSLARSALYRGLTTADPSLAGSLGQFFHPDIQRNAYPAPGSRIYAEGLHPDLMNRLGSALGITMAGPGGTPEEAERIAQGSSWSQGL